MKLTRYVSVNILSLVGNVGLFIFLLALWGNGYLSVLACRYFEKNCGNWAFMIAGVILIFPVDLLLNKIFHNKLTINIPIKNKYLRYTYYVIFCLGTVSAILYLSFYIHFVSILARL